MKHMLYLILLALLLVLSPAVLAEDGEDSEEESTEVSIDIGAWDADAEGSPDVVTEYEPNDGGPEVSLEIFHNQGWGHLLLGARVRDKEDQIYDLEFDVNRAIRSTTSYMRMIHRLGHDPLHNLETATNHGRVVWHTDLDPEGEYQISYRDLEHRTEFQPPTGENFTLGVNYRRQERHGVKQALTISHCDTCHVYSQGRPIDEITEDAGIDVWAAWGKGQVKASFTHRELDEGLSAITLLFDDALQPELRVPVFDNRLQWDSAQGPQPVHSRPDITKDIGKIELSFPGWAAAVVNLNGVWSTTENENTGLESDYTGTLLNVARSFKKNWKLRWRGQLYSIDNDSVFIDILEPAGIAGPQAGLTFREIYGFDPDFLRLSGLNRDVIESRLDVSYKISKTKGTVKFLWDFESIDREHYQVAPGETKTTENIFGVSWWARPKKGMRLSAALRRGDVDNPFGLVNGAFSTLFSPRVTSPFAPDAAQYYEFQDARIADTTASPESWDELKLGFNYVKENKTLSASYRYWDGDNTSGDLTDWSRNNQAFTLTLWVAPKEEWTWHLGYTWHQSELDFPTFIPIFDG